MKVFQKYEPLVFDHEDDMQKIILYLGAKTANKKKRKFFKLSKAQLIRNKPKNRIKNLINRPKNRAYRHANAPMIKRCQAQRDRLMDLNIHFGKLRRKA